MRIRPAYLLLVFLTLFSCSREETRGPLGEGSVTIRFSIADLQPTRAVTPGTESVADGGAIYASAGVPDLVILIADGNGDIVKRYSGSSPVNGTLESLTEAEASVAFAGLSEGTYTVYAFGNTEGLWTMTTDPSDGSISMSGSDLMSLSTADEVEVLQFKAMDADVNPALQNGRLPVSAKASLRVSANSNGEVCLELLRCVAKVTAIIINNSGEEITLYDYSHSFAGMCPDRGYVVPHTSDSPEGTNAGNLTASPALPITIPHNGTHPYSWYVFPSTGPYTADIGFTLFKDNVGGTERTYTYSSLPVTNWKAVNIPALERNQHLVVETRLSKGLTVSFNFEVAEWNPISEEVHFD